MSDIKFIDGLIVKAPHEKAPDFVKARLSIKREALIAWLQEQEGEWVNADVKVSQGGKWYAAVDEWKPEKRDERPASGERKQGGERSYSAPPPPRNDDPFPDDDIPF